MDSAVNRKVVKCRVKHHLKAYRTYKALAENVRLIMLETRRVGDDVHSRRVAMMENCLNILSDIQRFVVQCRLIAGMEWDKVMIEHKKQVGDDWLHISTLKRILDKALDRIADMLLEDDDVLADFMDW